MTIRSFAEAHVFGRLLFVCLALSSSAGPVPTTGKPAAYPSWWFEHDVIRYTPVVAAELAPQWPRDYAPADDYAAANIGQLKSIVFAAKQELDLAGGAGPQLSVMVGGYDMAPGLLGLYYPNRALAGSPVMSRNESIDFSWGTNSPSPSLPPEDFSIRWMGYLLPQVTGEYVLSFQSDDGCRLWLGDEILIDKWEDRVATDDLTPPRLLEAGKRYAIIAEYYEHGLYAEAKLRWRPPGHTEFVSIPAAQMRSATAAHLPHLGPLESDEYFNEYKTSLIARHGSAAPVVDDFAVANLGQLKAMAKPFYERLMEWGLAESFPWTGSQNVPNDYAAANIGQLKSLFSFSVPRFADADEDGINDLWARAHGLENSTLSEIFDATIDEDNDGLHDGWELYCFSRLDAQNANGDPDGDGLSNVLEANLRLDPLEAYVYEPLRFKLGVDKLTPTGAELVGYQLVSIQNRNPAGIIRYEIDSDSSNQSPVAVTVNSPAHYEGNYIDVPPLAFVRIHAALFVQGVIKRSDVITLDIWLPGRVRADPASPETIPIPSIPAPRHIYSRDHQIGISTAEFAHAVTPTSPNGLPGPARVFSYEAPYWLVRETALDTTVSGAKISLQDGRVYPDAAGIDYDAPIAWFTPVGVGYLIPNHPEFSRWHEIASLFSAFSPGPREYDAKATSPLYIQGSGTPELLRTFDGINYVPEPVTIIQDLTIQSEALSPVESRLWGSAPMDYLYMLGSVPDPSGVFIEPSMITDDTDGDGLTDIQEYLFGTEFDNEDTDGDTILDKHELLRAYLNPVIYGDGLHFVTDFDGDAWGYLEEITRREEALLAGTPTEIWNPFVNGSDSDRDGLSDSDETIRGTDPLYYDTDHDGLPDPVEIVLGHDPLKPEQVYLMGTARNVMFGRWQDFDGDLVPDAWANSANSNWDGDGDGLSWRDEWFIQSDPRRSDTDGDGLNDYVESRNGLNPTDGADGLVLANRDSDQDGLTDRFEIVHQINPWSADTDTDGVTDSRELELGTLPDNRDSDDDLIPDGWELAHGMNPLNYNDALLDFDGNGVSNLVEYQNSTGDLGGGGPILKVLDGAGQVGPPGYFLPKPLTVEARDGNGNVLVNVAITFRAAPGQGRFATSPEPDAELHDELVVHTDSLGLAWVYWKL